MDPLHVLVIDDDEVMNFLFGRAISSFALNCKFHCFTTGEAGLAYLGETDRFPDVILLDYQLPKMDGFDFLLEYEKRGYHQAHQILFFMLSSFSRKELAEPLSTFEFVEGFIEKPLTPIKLQELLVNYFPAIKKKVER
ncbi:MAG: response regulator [Bacteroidota bacterium]